jgi:hypothetical protein
MNEALDIGPWEIGITSISKIKALNFEMESSNVIILNFM